MSHEEIKQFFDKLEKHFKIITLNKYSPEIIFYCSKCEKQTIFACAVTYSYKAQQKGSFPLCVKHMKEHYMNIHKGNLWFWNRTDFWHIRSSSKCGSLHFSLPYSEYNIKHILPKGYYDTPTYSFAKCINSEIIQKKEIKSFRQAYITKIIRQYARIIWLQKYTDTDCDMNQLSAFFERYPGLKCFIGRIILMYFSFSFNL